MFHWMFRLNKKSVASSIFVFPQCWDYRRMPPYLASYICCCYLGVVHKLLGILYSYLLTTKDCLGSPQLFTLKMPYGVLEKWLRDEERMFFFAENPALVPWFPVSMLGHSQQPVTPYLVVFCFS